MDIISFINHSAFYFGAIFVSLSCLIYMAIQKKMDKPHTRIFVMALWTIIITSICNMASILTEPYCLEYTSARTIMFISHYLFFVVHNLLSLFLCYYVFFATQSFIRMKRVVQFLYLIPSVVSEFFMLTNPINHWSWDYDISLKFQRRWGESTLYIAGVIYLIVSIYYLLFRWYAATKKRKLLIVVAFGFAVVGIVLQYFQPILETELFFEALTCLGLMLSVEYDEDRMDAVSRLFNRNAFIQDAGYYCDTHSKFDVIILRITNYDTYQKMPDSYDINDIVEALSEGLDSIYMRFATYRVTPSCFVCLVLNRNKEYVDNLANKVQELYAEGFNLPKKDERITGFVIQTEVPKEISSVKELLLICEMDFKQFDSNRVLKGDDLVEFFDRSSIERAIRDGITEHNFEVLYQLVYNTKSGMVNSAEALLRLKDSKLGEMMPKTFIPAAEKNGMIDVVGEYVLRDVCHFINTGIPEKVGIGYINVNVSVLQCMQPHFMERAKAIVDKESVDPSMINFEITESVASEDYGYLADVINKCKQCGFRFSMEGYGTGYSNMYSVFSLDFDEIKIDKTLLWEADKSESGKLIFENCVRMLHELGKPVVAVGVETKQQIERLKMLDVEFVQGFYYDEPKPGAKLGIVDHLVRS